MQISLLTTGGAGPSYGILIPPLATDVSSAFSYTPTGGVVLAGHARVVPNTWATSGVHIGGTATVSHVSNPPPTLHGVIDGFSGSLSGSLINAVQGVIDGFNGSLAGHISPAISGYLRLGGALTGIPGRTATINGVLDTTITLNATVNSAWVYGSFGGVHGAGTGLPGRTAKLQGSFAELLATSTAHTNPVVTISGSFGGLDGALLGVRGVVGTIHGALTLDATFQGVMGHGATITAQFGGLSSSIHCFMNVSGYVTGKIGPLSATFQALAAANLTPVTITVMNTTNNAVTEFTDLDFDSVAYFQGRAIFASPTGLWVVGGTDAISATVTTGITDYNSIQQKRLTDAYVGYASASTLALSVTAGANTYTYNLPSRAPANATQVGRATIGRGLVDRYFQYMLSNPDGSAFKFFALDVSTLEMTRRV